MFNGKLLFLTGAGVSIIFGGKIVYSAPQKIIREKTFYKGDKITTVRQDPDGSVITKSRENRAAGEVITIQGTRKTPVKIQSNGTTVRGVGSKPTIDMTSNSSADVLDLNNKSNLTVENLTIKGGLRGIDCRGASNVTITKVTTEKCGKSGNKPGTGGAVLGGQSKNFTFQDCQFLNTRGHHAWYFAETASDIKVLRCKFSNAGSGNSNFIVQLNSEAGKGIERVRFDDCEIVNKAAINALGAGFAKDAVIFRNCIIKATGRGVNADNYSAGRPSYLKLENCDVTGNPTVRAAERSVVYLSGGTYKGGKAQTSSGGKVIKE